MTHTDRRIAAADPLRVDVQALPDEAGLALAQEILMQVATPSSPTGAPGDPPPRRRRRHRAYVLGAVLAGLVAVPSIAVAVSQGMHSGMIGTGGESVAGEEFLYSDAPEIKDVVRELTGEFPLPDGASYDRLLARYPTNERTLIQRTALGQEVAMTAVCAWYRDWQGAGPARRAADQRTIDAIPTWKYWNFAVSDTVEPGSDPDPGLTILKRIAAETRAGQDKTLAQYVVANC